MNWRREMGFRRDQDVRLEGKMSATVPEQSSHCSCGEEFIPLWTENPEQEPKEIRVVHFSWRGGVICGIHDPPSGA